MKALFVMAAGALLLSGIASAAELPSYGLGFSISLHQLSVMGTAANVKEQSPSTSLLVAGMPASPHQVSVLTPRPRMIESLAAATHPLGQASFSIR
jgi:hypothetical protein